MKKRKLLLVGCNSVHIFNYCALVQDFFEEVVLITETGEQLSDKWPVLKIDFSLRNPFLIRKNIHQLKEIIMLHKPDIIHV
jgi:hypothetical protein